MITEFELQKGDGIAVDIVPANDDDDFWIIADEDDLVKMIQIAFDCPTFTINHLIDGLRVACEGYKPLGDHFTFADGSELVVKGRAPVALLGTTSQADLAYQKVLPILKGE